MKVTLYGRNQLLSLTAKQQSHIYLPFVNKLHIYTFKIMLRPIRRLLSFRNIFVDMLVPILPDSRQLSAK